ncbi:MAG TPA: hypothetical protein VFH68_02060 [Polyangia bacterium]|nr:hypothetical protein [Polyangia bacterium]
MTVAAWGRAPGRLARLGALVIALLATPRTLAQAPPAGQKRAGASTGADVAVTIISGDDTCAPRLRALLAEQLIGVARDLSWSCRSRFDQEEIFQPAAPSQAPAVRIWIDVSASDEARLTWGDQPAQRFVLRRVPLARGLDEVGREEIAQIVRSAALALLQGTAETLTPAQARVAIADRAAARRPAAVALSPVPAPARSQAPVPSHALAARVVVGPAWSLRAFSRQIPVVQEIALGAAVTPREWPLSAWGEVGYRLPATYRSRPVGVELGAAALRAGLTLGPRAIEPDHSWLAWHVGAGAGLERVWFAPLDPAASFESTRATPFFAVLARVLLGVEARPAPHAVIALNLFGDLATSEVHFDYRSGDGAVHRVLTALALEPGISLGVGWRP